MPHTFDTAVRENHGRLLAVARRFARNDADAEDLVQDALARAFAVWSTFDPEAPGGAVAWLLRILRNAFLSECRRRRVRAVALEARPADVVGAAHAAEPYAWGDLATAALVAEAVADLPEHLRTVIRAVDVRGATCAATAAALGVPIGTVLSRLQRGRTELRESPLGVHARRHDIGTGSALPKRRRRAA